MSYKHLFRSHLLERLFRSKREVMAVVACMGGYLLILIHRAAVNVPFQDEFAFSRIYSALAHGQLPTVKELVVAHNGHPYLLLKLLFVLTLDVGAPWSWMMYAQVPILLGGFGIVLRRVDQRQAGWAVTALVIGLVLITPRQWEDLYWAMQISAALATLAAIGGFFCVAKYEQSSSRRWLWGGLGLGLLASVNTGAGVLAFAIIMAGLLLVGARWADRLLTVATLCVGIAFYTWAEMLAGPEGSGVGSVQPAAGLFIKHVVMMFANAVAFYGKHHEQVGLAVGAAMIIMTLYCGALALSQWRKSLFEIGCILWGLGLVVVVSYTRLSMGIYQPDAPRYVPLVAPLVIGCALIMHKRANRKALTLLAAALTVGYLQSAVSEWRATPIRNAIQTSALHRLCADGHVSKSGMSARQIRDIQKLFCASEKRARTSG